MDYNEYTVMITTKNGYFDYLVINKPVGEDLSDDDVLIEFDLYKNDEAGEIFKNDEIISYTIIRKA